MGAHKTSARKIRIIKKTKQTSSVPAWVNLHVFVKRTRISEPHIATRTEAGVPPLIFTPDGIFDRILRTCDISNTMPVHTADIGVSSRF